MDTNKRQDKSREKQGKDQGKAEQLLNKLVPPGQEVSDDELKDPGRATPESPPTDDRS